ncbi:MAG: ABC transporter substrate-binding protein, partial [Ruthenibacterium sp.]
MKKVLALLLCAAMALSVTACGNTPAASTPAENTAAGSTSTSGETFKVGAYFGLTGAQSVYGVEATNAIKMGIDYINAKGGFNGVPAELVLYDTQTSPEEAIKIVNKLVAQDHINACIGSMNSGEVLASAGYLNDAGIYTLGCGTSPTWMQKDWPFVFRAAMNNDFGSPMSVKMATDTGAKNCAILYGQDDSSIATYNSLKAAAEKDGLEIISEQSYDNG